MDGWRPVHLGHVLTTLFTAKYHILTSLFFQTVFADQPQVAYIQQDGTTQQVSLSAIVKLPALFCTTLFLENP